MKQFTTSRLLCGLWDAVIQLYFFIKIDELITVVATLIYTYGICLVSLQCTYNWSKASSLKKKKYIITIEVNKMFLLSMRMHKILFP